MFLVSKCFHRWPPGKYPLWMSRRPRCPLGRRLCSRRSTCGRRATGTRRCREAGRRTNRLCSWRDTKERGNHVLMTFLMSWVNSLFKLLAILGNKNWPPSMKVKKMENFQNKSGLMGCIWSSLNAQGTGNPLSHPVLELEFSHFWPYGVIRIGLPV